MNSIRARELLIAITSPPRDYSWHKDANCKGLDNNTFFPTNATSNTDIQSAKAICFTCSVQDICLGYALSQETVFGIWGGTSEKERRKLKKTLGGKT